MRWTHVRDAPPATRAGRMRRKAARGATAGSRGRIGQQAFGSREPEDLQKRVTRKVRSSKRTASARRNDELHSRAEAW